MAHNVTHAIEGDYLVVRVRITEADAAAAPPSSTGKSVLIGSTGGYVKLDKTVGGVNLSMTAMVCGTAPKGR